MNENKIQATPNKMKLNITQWFVWIQK